MTDLSEYLPRRGRTPSIVRINLRAHQYKRLERAAEQRNMSAPDLMNLIAGVIINDNLIDAVLDDLDAGGKPLQSRTTR